MDLPTKLLAVAAVGAIVAAFTLAGGQATPQPPAPAVQAPEGSKSIIVAGGCFWCVESQYQELKGVIDVESAYVGGRKQGVTYAEICEGDTGHAEAIKVTFDPKVVSGDDLLRIFFTLHDPTTLNAQGPDHGTQYRSAIFYTTPEEKEAAERIRAEIKAQKLWKNPIVTTVEEAKNYTRAEEYHQDYFAKYEKAGPVEKMRMNGGYCAAIIQPKVAKFRKEYAEKLKKG